MTTTTLRNAIITKMVSGNWSEPVQYPNQSGWVTPNNEPWLRVAIFFPRDNRVTLSSTDRQPVLVQVDIFAPRESGQLTALGLADKLQALFSKREVTEITGGRFEVTRFRAVPTDDDTYYRVMCEIDIVAHLERT